MANPSSPYKPRLKGENLPQKKQENEKVLQRGREKTNTYNLIKEGKNRLIFKNMQLP